MVKNPPAMQETGVQSLGWEDPLEEGMATHSSIPAWRIPHGQRSLALQSMGFQRVGHGWATKTHTHTHTHTHSSILVRFKKEVLLLTTTWMNLEDNMVGEISPLQDKYCVTPLTWAIQNGQTQKQNGELPGSAGGRSRSCVRWVQLQLCRMSKF